jgi:hypothetical protein
MAAEVMITHQGTALCKRRGGLKARPLLRIRYGKPPFLAIV